MKFSLRNLLLCVSLVSLVMAAIAGFRSYFSPHRMGVSASVANRMIWSEYRLPETAQDVTYYVDFGACAVEFAITESDFLKFCDKRGWAIEKITSPVRYFQPIWFPQDDRPVAAGYIINVPHGRGVFDAERSRAAVWGSTFP